MTVGDTANRVAENLESTTPEHARRSRLHTSSEGPLSPKAPPFLSRCWFEA